MHKISRKSDFEDSRGIITDLILEEIHGVTHITFEKVAVELGVKIDWKGEGQKEVGYISGKVAVKVSLVSYRTYLSSMGFLILSF